MYIILIFAGVRCLNTECRNCKCEFRWIYDISSMLDYLGIQICRLSTGCSDWYTFFGRLWVKSSSYLYFTNCRCGRHPFANNIVHLSTHPTFKLVFIFALAILLCHIPPLANKCMLWVTWKSVATFTLWLGSVCAWKGELWCWIPSGQEGVCGKVYAFTALLSDID